MTKERENVKEIGINKTREGVETNKKGVESRKEIEKKKRVRDR